MLIPSDINTIFDIDKKVDKVDMEICDSDVDSILDATDGVGQTWEVVKDDNTISEGMSEIERFKTYSFSVEEYEKWIKNLEKAGLSYVRHDRRNQLDGVRKKFRWTEQWYYHRYEK